MRYDYINKFIILLLFSFFLSGCDEQEKEGGFKHPAMSAMESKDEIHVTPIFCEKKFKEFQFQIGEYSGIISTDGNIKGKLSHECEYKSDKWNSHEEGHKFTIEVPEDYDRECEEDSIYHFNLVSCTEWEGDSPIMEVVVKDVEERKKYHCELEEVGENLNLKCPDEYIE